MNDDEFNGNGRDSSPIRELDDVGLRGVLEHTIHRQHADERVINRLDREMRSLAAGTTKWQGEVNVRLERIEGCIQLITNQIMIVQWIRVSVPRLLAFFGGGFCAALVIYLITHK